MAAMLRFLLLSVALFLAGCAGTSYQQDPPKIILDGVHSAAGQTGAPRFRIDLRVQNPNAEPLDIAGISYEVLVQDVELLSGVTSDVPVIQGYSEEPVTVEAGLNALQLLRFFTRLGSGEQTLDRLEYTFRAKVDFRGFVPTQRIEETGVIGAPGTASAR